MVSPALRIAAALGLLAGFLAVTPAAQAAAKPSAPVMTSIAPQWNSVTVAWKPAARATSYSLCLYSSGSAKSCAHTSAKTKGTVAQLLNLKPTSGKDYYAVVRAHGTGGTTASRRIGFDLKPDPRPKAPSTVAHRTTSARSAVITWSAVPKAIQYQACLITSATERPCGTQQVVTTTGFHFFGLAPNSGRDYYYMVRARVGNYWSDWSKRGEFDLPVAHATAPKATAGPGQAKVTWDAATNADSYWLRVATNAAMTEGGRTYTTSSPSYTLGGLSGGETYYLAVRGMNDTTGGGWSGVVPVEIPDDPVYADVSLATFNLCGQNKCVGSTKIPTWSSRAQPVADQIWRTGVNIVSTQESHDRETNIVSRLPGFKVAAYYRSKTLLYKASMYSVKRSGSMTLDSSRSRYGVWAEFEDIASGTRFLVVDPHIEPGKGVSLDKVRTAQMAKLLAETDRVNSADLPVVWAGDFNSNASNADQKKYKGGYDAPRRSFLAAGARDAKEAAPASARLNLDFNSASQGKNPPLRHGHHVDQIWVDSRIQVTWFGVMPRIQGGLYLKPFLSDHNLVKAVVRIPKTT